MEILLAWGADVNAETQGQQTPLHLAAFCGNSRDTLQLLIMHPDLRPQSFNCQQAGTYFCEFIIARHLKIVHMGADIFQSGATFSQFIRPNLDFHSIYRILT